VLALGPHELVYRGGRDQAHRLVKLHAAQPERHQMVRDRAGVPAPGLPGGRGPHLGAALRAGAYLAAAVIVARLGVAALESARVRKILHVSAYEPARESRS
jgi:hypothetical protein